MIKVLISFIVFLTGEAFFAGSEIAFISAEKLLVQRLARRNLLARMCVKFWQDPERLFTTTVLGMTLCISGNGIFTSYFLIHSFGKWGVLISSSLLPISMVVFGQIIPKSLGKKFAYPLILYVAPFLYITSFLFLPVIWINKKLTSVFLKSKKENPFFLTRFREVFLNFIYYEEEIDLKEKELMQKILEFSNKKVSQVMIPITQVKGLPINVKVKDVLEFSRKYNFSYVPLYEKDLSHIKGILKVQNLMGEVLLNPEASIKPFIRQPLFVPEVALAHEVLTRLQNQGLEVAIVVDEYGSTTGLITIEDLIEEVLGEFRDALDYYVPEYHKISENTYVVKGHIEVEKLQSLGIPIPSGDYETLNGFIYSITGKIPSQGEEIQYKNIKFKILKATPQTVEEVLITLKN